MKYTVCINKFELRKLIFNFLEGNNLGLVIEKRRSTPLTDTSIVYNGLCHTMGTNQEQN